MQNALSPPSPSFIAASVHAPVEVRHDRSGRPFGVGRVILIDDQGDPHASIEVGSEEAGDGENAIRAFLAGSGAPTIELKLAGPRFLLALALPLFLLSAAIARRAMRSSGRVQLRLLDSRQALQITPRGWGLGRSQRVPLTGASGVDIEWHFPKVPADSRPGEAYARLWLRTAVGGVPIPLEFARGYSAHVSGALALRALLGLPPQQDFVPFVAQPQRGGG